MIPYLVIDCETTTYEKGNPYSRRNKLCLVGVKDPTGKEYIYDIEYTDHGYVDELQKLQELINHTNLIIGFNLKFDLAWLRRYGIKYDHCKVFDCQLAHFILSGQKDSYPSLNGVAESHELEQKLDEVKECYWNKGIDTPQIPLSILTEYLSKDLQITQQVYLKQLEYSSSCTHQMKKLISLSNQDLLVLLEMEWNGLKINFQQMEQESVKTTTAIENLRKEIDGYFGDVPAYCRNYSSGDCLSALLYGGLVKEYTRVVLGQYKTGEKIGQDRYRIITTEHMLPRRFEPPKGSELKKDGYFATSEETLRSIKADKAGRVLLNQLLDMSKLEKLNSTYYKGLADLAVEKDWEEGEIHGQFNQVVARTGRLSSSNPNLQNMPPEMDALIITRY